MATDADAAFAAVLGKPVSAVRVIISRLSESTTIANYASRMPFFIDDVGTLRDLALDDVAGTAISQGRGMDTIQPHRPGDEGSYGVVFRSTDGRSVYKSITFPKSSDQDNISASKVNPYRYFEKKIRDVYIETFIQVVLSNDETVGHYICRPLNLYRSPMVRRIRGSNTPLDRYKLFISMEPNPYKFDEYINTLPRPLDIRSFGHILIELGETLAHLRATYNYCHRDLHRGNIMISADGHLKLIDFGFSCMTYKGQTYRQVDEVGDAATGCEPGYDLAIFFSSFYSAYRGVMSPETTRFFEENLGRRAPFNIFAYGDWFQDIGQGAPFHAFYYWNMNSIIGRSNPRTLGSILATLPILEPTRLIELVQEAMILPENLGIAAAAAGPDGLFSPGVRRHIVPTNNSVNSPVGFCDGLYNATLGKCFPRTYGAKKTQRKTRKTKETRKSRKARKTRNNRK